MYRALLEGVQGSFIAGVSVFERAVFEQYCGGACIYIGLFSECTGLF